MSPNIKALPWAECFAPGNPAVEAAIVFAWENEKTCDCFDALKDAPELKDFTGKSSQLHPLSHEKQGKSLQRRELRAD